MFTTLQRDPHKENPLFICNRKILLHCNVIFYVFFYRNTSFIHCFYVLFYSSCCSLHNINNFTSLTMENIIWNTIKINFNDVRDPSKWILFVAKLIQHILSSCHLINSTIINWISNDHVRQCTTECREMINGLFVWENAITYSDTCRRLVQLFLASRHPSFP